MEISRRNSRLSSPVAGVTLEYVKLPTGITLRVAKAGDPTGPALLFMHGWPESWFSWRHQIVFFASKGYRVLAPDMRGYGGSDAPLPVEEYDCFSIHSDMISLLQVKGISKAILIGHDWGAALTWILGRLSPDYFPALVALSVPHAMRKGTNSGGVDPIHALENIFGKGEDAMFFYQLYHNERSPGTRDSGPAEAEYDANPRETIYRIWTDNTVPKDEPTGNGSGLRRDGGMFGQNFLGGRPKRLPSWLSDSDLAYVSEQFKASGFRGGVNYYRNISRNWRLTPHFLNQKVRQPCMFLTGEHDVVVRFQPGGTDKQRARLEEVCEDLRSFCVIRGNGKDKSAGHWIQQERPDEVNAEILRFLRSVARDFAAAPGGAVFPATGASSRL